MKICINVRLGGNWYLILPFREAGGGKLAHPKCLCLWEIQCCFSIWPDLLLAHEWWTELQVAYKIESSVGFLPSERGRLVRWREDQGIKKLLPDDREENTYVHVSVSIYVHIYAIYFRDRYLSDIYISVMYLSLSLMFNLDGKEPIVCHRKIMGQAARPEQAAA